MKTVLHIPYYTDKNLVRQGEIMYCLHKNLQAGFDKIMFYFDNLNELLYLSKYLQTISDNAGIITTMLPELVFVNPDVQQQNRRPTFNDFLANTQADCINVISNTDIFFTPESVTKISNYMQQKPQDALCLSRWDIAANGEATHFERWDSQDVWVINGSAKGRTTTEFTMGVAGCDNRFAWELKNMGYNICNPSKSIQVFHKHESAVRNYLNEQGAPTSSVPQPYEMVTPE